MTPAQTHILTETPFPEWACDIERARVANGIPGMSVAVVHKGKVIFAQGFGRRNENNDPFTEEVTTCSYTQGSSLYSTPPFDAHYHLERGE